MLFPTSVFILLTIFIYATHCYENNSFVNHVPVLTKPASRTYNCLVSSNKNCDLLKTDLNEESIKHRRLSQLQMKDYNDTHFVTPIWWTIADKGLTVADVKVYLTSYKGTTKLGCSFKDRIQNSVLQLDCYIPTEDAEDLLYRSKGFGFVESMLKLFGNDETFHQVADVSLNEPSKPFVSLFHGFVSDPPGRAKLCQMRINQDCGQVTYEPQSVEGFKGFPDRKHSPPDGKIASGNNPNFDRLNEYGLNRWTRVPFPKVECLNKTHVSFNLSWSLTAVHSTENIRIYVSNKKYTPEEPLSRKHLDLDPLCTLNFYGKLPSYSVVIFCPVSLEKYEELTTFDEVLLLGVWNIFDTSMAFYQVIDLEGPDEKQFYENIIEKCS